MASTAPVNPGPSGFRLRPIVMVGGLLAVCAIYAAYAFFQANQQPAADPTILPQIEISSHSSPRSWQEIVDRTSRSIEARQAALAGNPDDWGDNSSLASAYVSRGRLTGNYDDFAQADRLFDTAFAVAPDGVGPHRARAAFNYLLHRLSRAQSDLDATENYALPPSAKDRAQVLGMHGDIAFFRGEYGRALTIYRQAESSTPDQSGAFRLFNYHAYLGSAADAARYFAMLVERPAAGEERSFVAMTRGRYELIRGRYASALESFRTADRLFPGDWRIEALIAQMAALDGRRDVAAAIFERIAEQRDSPEAMDALAAIYRYQGNGALSRRWAARAGAIWDRRLSQFPEAVYAHALDHELAFGDPERALELARGNWEARPYGDAGIALTWALIANGQADAARQRIDQVIASGWRSYDVHVAAARVYALLGDSDAAEAHREQALAFNPHAFDSEAALLWFAH